MPHAKVFMFCNGYSDFASACIEWATDLLIKGHYTDNIAVVAGHTSPLDFHELRTDTLNALKDVGVVIPSDRDYTQLIARALVEEMVCDSNTVAANLEILAGVYIEDDYVDDLYKFYLLWHAYDTLFNFGESVQWYWDGIDSKNFNEKAQEFFVGWLESA